MDGICCPIAANYTRTHMALSIIALVIAGLEGETFDYYTTLLIFICSFMNYIISQQLIRFDSFFNFSQVQISTNC